MTVSFVRMPGRGGNFHRRRFDKFLSLTVKD
jgi:hypothetical protein